MRFRTEKDLQAIITDRIPEAASLEYKSELPLGSTSERLEALKDLTGIGTGGGGSVIYGMAEGPGDWPVATALQPLTDRSLIGRLENICRSGVRPPLIAEFHAVDVQGGYVLTVDVQPSPLGPYMIEAYGQRRYHIRRGRHVDRMTEREVRDAYALALRARERRPEVWRDHGLPRDAPSNEPWLVVSALPEEPLTEILDMLTVTATDLQPSAKMATYINNWEAGDLTPALQALTRWIDGFQAVDEHQGVHREIRVHRDGAAAIATRIQTQQGILYPTKAARVANATLLYLGWFWHRFGLARPIEIHIALHNALGLALHLGIKDRIQVSGQIVGPPGINIDPIVKIDLVLPQTATRASVRHHLLMTFIDRLYQAAGEMRSDALFRRGHLYDRAGKAIDILVGGATIYDIPGRRQIGWVLDDGMVLGGHSSDHVGWYDNGVITDRQGDAVAVLEFAPGVGCPDDFVGTALRPDPNEGLEYVNGRPEPGRGGAERPGFTGCWSAVDLRALLGI